MTAWTYHPTDGEVRDDEGRRVALVGDRDWPSLGVADRHGELLAAAPALAAALRALAVEFESEIRSEYWGTASLAEKLEPHAAAVALLERLPLEEEEDPR